MTAQQIIEMAVGYRHISKAELARRMGWSPQLLGKRLKTAKFTIDEWEALANQLLGKRLKTAKFTIDEWEALAKALGGEFQYGFTFDDGTKIGL